MLQGLTGRWTRTRAEVGCDGGGIDGSAGSAPSSGSFSSAQRPKMKTMNKSEKSQAEL
jgi:hypothetical protein